MAKKIQNITLLIATLYVAYHIYSFGWQTNNMLMAGGLLFLVIMNGWQHSKARVRLQERAKEELEKREKEQ